MKIQGRCPRNTRRNSALITGLDPTSQQYMAPFHLLAVASCLVPSQGGVVPVETKGWSERGCCKVELYSGTFLPYLSVCVLFGERAVSGLGVHIRLDPGLWNNVYPGLSMLGDVLARRQVNSQFWGQKIWLVFLPSGQNSPRHRLPQVHIIPQSGIKAY